MGRLLSVFLILVSGFGAADPLSTHVISQFSGTSKIVSDGMRTVTSAFQGEPVGPKQGTLIVQGGGWPFDPKFVDAFVQSAGGKDKKFVIVTTALPYKKLKSENTWTFIKSWLAEAGVEDIEFIPAPDIRVPNELKIEERLKAEGKSEAQIDEELQRLYLEHVRALTRDPSFGEKVKQANGVFFWGGRQWKFVDAFLDTPFVSALESVLAKGGVIAGSSAGASIQASYLARGDEKSKDEIISQDPPEKNHQRGFGFLKNVAIDQHGFKRGRLFEMFEILEGHPEHLGITLAEDSALVIEGDFARVIGGPVAIYDGTQLFPGRGPFGVTIEPIPRGEKRFYTIHEGQTYDLRWRKDIRASPRAFFDYVSKPRTLYQMLKPLPFIH